MNRELNEFLPLQEEIREIREKRKGQEMHGKEREK